MGQNNDGVFRWRLIKLRYEQYKHKTQEFMWTKSEQIFFNIFLEGALIKYGMKKSEYNGSLYWEKELQIVTIILSTNKWQIVRNKCLGFILYLGLEK